MSDVADLARLLLGIGLRIGLTQAILVRDRGKLGSERLARAWNGPTWACAVVFFGPLCLVAHFWITRDRLAPRLEGMMWAVILLSIAVAIDEGLVVLLD